MEMKFTASIIEAIECLSRLQSGRYKVVPKGGKWLHEGGGVLLEAPVWCNFSFFSRIKASPIRRKSRLEPDKDHVGCWRLERVVEFYHHGKCVAVVELAGIKYDTFTGGLDNGGMWAVSGLGYYWRFDHVDPEDWREIQLEVTGYTGRPMV